MKLSQQALDALTKMGIPDYMHGAIIRFYEKGLPPGSFLSSVINNDLREAILRADETNSNLMKNYVQWFYWYAPAGSWGWTGAVERWIKSFHEDKNTRQQAEDSVEQEI